MQQGLFVRHPRPLVGAAFLLSISICAAARAEDSTVPLDPVLITAARIEQRLDEALPAATVITRAQIERLQATDLIELLGRQAGVEFSRAGGAGSQASLFVRGASSSQVLVLIDGARLNTALGGFAPFGALTIDSIERIEIVRGNLSSLYGSEAIGGVIQLFTREAARSGAQATIETGSGHARAASASIAQHFDAGSIAVTAAERRSAPFSAIDTARVVPGPFSPGANPDIDGNRNRSGALRAKAKIGTLQVDASVRGARSDTDFDSTADGPSATHEEQTRQTAAQISVRAPLSERWRTRLQLAQSRDDTRNHSSEPFSFNNGQFEARNRFALLDNEVQLTQRVTATLAFEHLEQSGASTSYDPGLAGVLTRFDRRVNSVQAGAVGSAGAQRLQINVRHDEYSDAGSATTGLIAYGYDLSRDWRVSLQLANAFRAPSFNDLYFPFFGNPQLAPERARSVELGLRFASGPSSARASLYRTRTRDLIVFDPASSQAQNISRAVSDGFEFAAATVLRQWRLEVNAAILRARDLDTGERLLRRAPYTLHLAATHEAGRLSSGIELSRVGARFDSDINTFARTRLAAYTLARVALAWRFSTTVQFKLRLENLFDTHYALVDGYNTPRRGIFAALLLRL